MARREPEDFDGVEPALVYVARAMRHARRVEHLLTEAGIDYVVETDTVGSGFLFPTQRMGAFFYVRPVDEGRAATAIAVEGFRLIVR